MRRRRALAASVVAAMLGLAAACADDPVARRCTHIPAGGCPLSRGVACEDPECEAVYACLPGDEWELRQTCPPREGRARPDASAASDAEAPFDAAFDAPPGSFGGPGCESLQAPDCMLGLALACGADCCGCEELFICEDRGWTLWGTCGDGGVTPRR